MKTLDLNNDNIYETEECITEIAIQKTSCKVRPKNTVLVAMYGGFNQIGRTGLLKIEAATNQAVSSIIVDNSVIKPEYLLYVLNMKKKILLTLFLTTILYLVCEHLGNKNSTDAKNITRDEGYRGIVKKCDDNETTI